MTKFKQILTFDGGGIRGIASAVWLKKLVDSGRIKLDDIYMFSGTSTGSLIAASLAVGKTPDEIIQLYKDLAPEIFDRAFWKPKWLDVLVFSAPYDVKVLNRVIRKHFGDITLGEIKRRLVIPIWDLHGNHRGKTAACCLMANNFSQGHEYMKSWKLSDVLTGSCAAPTYFAPHVFTDSSGTMRKWTDGGQVDNTAIQSTLIASLDMMGANLKREEISMMSIGNGYKFASEHPKENGGWALPRRLRSLINGIVQSNQLLGVTMAGRMLFSFFERVNFPLEKEIELDDASQIEWLEKWANDKDLKEYENWLMGFFV